MRHNFLQLLAHMANFQSWGVLPAYQSGRRPNPAKRWKTTQTVSRNPRDPNSPAISAASAKRAMRALKAERDALRSYANNHAADFRFYPLIEA